MIPYLSLRRQHQLHHALVKKVRMLRRPRRATNTAIHGRVEIQQPGESAGSPISVEYVLDMWKRVWSSLAALFRTTFKITTPMST